MKPATQKTDDIGLEKNFLTHQYNSVRAEILKRIELRQRVQIFVYIFAGTVFSIGTYEKIEPSILLIYPVIALFLAISWSNHDTRIGELHYFVRTKIESHFQHQGWDTYFFEELVQPKSRGLLYSTNELSVLGAILITQLLAIGLVLFDLTINLTNILLLAVAVTSIILTFVVLRKRRKNIKPD